MRESREGIAQGLERGVWRENREEVASSCRRTRLPVDHADARLHDRALEEAARAPLVVLRPALVQGALAQLAGVALPQEDVDQWRGTCMHMHKQMTHAHAHAYEHAAHAHAHMSISGAAPASMSAGTTCDSAPSTSCVGPERQCGARTSG